jgi:hypothetical protein
MDDGLAKIEYSRKLKSLRSKTTPDNLSKKGILYKLPHA